jgi:lactoylglutathione lyase
MSVFEATTERNPLNFSWQQTMLRIKDPKISVPFYEKNFGFKLIHSYDFPQWSFSLYFLAILPEDEVFPFTPGTPESAAYLWTMKGVALELTHNYGTETDDTFRVNNGNVEPYRGFGHIAVMTPDVYASSAQLEAQGVLFQKRPDEGRMKGLAFALDPDGYWIEIVSRSVASTVSTALSYTLAQTMLRVSDPVKAVAFYRDLLGMTLLRAIHLGDFSLYFLAHLTASEQAQWQHLQQQASATGEQVNSGEFIRCIFSPVLELTHNHGTELQPAFRYHSGNEQEGGRGFGHTGFLVDDLQAACNMLEQRGVSLRKRPEEGSMRGMAFALDPDGYWVELIQRGSGPAV